MIKINKKVIAAWWLIAMFTLPVTLAHANLDNLLAAMEMKPYPPGWDAPHFGALTATGESVTLADYRGKVLMVTFWATWCVPCRKEMPALEELQFKFGDRGLRVIGINFKEDEAKIRHFAKLYGLSFPLLLDTTGSITKTYGVVAFPTTFLIGRDGKPIALAVGERDWLSDAAMALLDALLRKTPGK